MTIVFLFTAFGAVGSFLAALCGVVAAYRDRDPISPEELARADQRSLSWPGDGSIFRSYNSVPPAVNRFRRREEVAWRAKEAARQAAEERDLEGILESPEASEEEKRLARIALAGKLHIQAQRAIVSDAAAGEEDRREAQQVIRRRIAGGA